MKSNFMMYILVYMGIIIVTVGIIMEIITINGSSSSQYSDFEKEYMNYINVCFRCGTILIVCMWLLTNGKIDAIVTNSLTIISCAWFAVFINSICKTLYLKVKKSQNYNIQGINYIKISNSCLIKFLVTAVVVWFIR